MSLMILGAVWGLLTGTRLLRGEEDQGRWELLLAGGPRRARATGQALAGLGAGVAVLWALTAARDRGRRSGPEGRVSPSDRRAYFALAMVADARRVRRRRRGDQPAGRDPATGRGMGGGRARGRLRAAHGRRRRASASTGWSGRRRSAGSRSCGALTAPRPLRPRPDPRPHRRARPPPPSSWPAGATSGRAWCPTGTGAGPAWAARRPGSAWPCG